MTNYHLNPDTGNAGICKAKIGNCKYKLSAESHFDSLESAMSASENNLSKKHNNYLKGVQNPKKPSEKSELVKLVLIRSELQREILKLSAADGSFEDIVSSGLMEKRDQTEKLIYEFNEQSNKEQNDDFHYPNDEKVKIPSFEFNDGDRVGLPNDMEELELTNHELVNQMSTASETWANRLSNTEMTAILQYASSSKEYAIADRSTESMRKNLHSALSKAPKFSKETTVYSGLSSEVRKLVLDQIDSGAKVITLDRAQSTSLNPAQVNGFMSGWVKKDGQTVKEITVALEIQTYSGAIMTRVSQAPHEMEVLLPPGKYEFLEEYKDINYLWEKEGVGRTANRVIKLRRIEE